MGDVFNMQSQEELNRWMASTIQFAFISSGLSEVDEFDIHQRVRGVIGRLQEQGVVLTLRAVVSAVLDEAVLILGVERVIGDVFVVSDDLLYVAQWTLKTIAVVWVARGRAFHHEQVEAKADELVSGIQGNRVCPCRDDLDRVVKKVISWGVEELMRGVFEVAGKSSLDQGSVCG